MGTENGGGRNSISECGMGNSGCGMRPPAHRAYAPEGRRKELNVEDSKKPAGGSNHPNEPNVLNSIHKPPRSTGMRIEKVPAVTARTCFMGANLSDTGGL
jgi:hypothetical protein